MVETPSTNSANKPYCLLKTDETLRYGSGRDRSGKPTADRGVSQGRRGFGTDSPDLSPEISDKMKYSCEGTRIKTKTSKIVIR